MKMKKSRNGAQLGTMLKKSTWRFMFSVKRGNSYLLVKKVTKNKRSETH